MNVLGCRHGIQRKRKLWRFLVFRKLFSLHVSTKSQNDDAVIEPWYSHINQRNGGSQWFNNWIRSWTRCDCSIYLNFLSRSRMHSAFSDHSRIVLSLSLGASPCPARSISHSYTLLLPRFSTVIHQGLPPPSPPPPPTVPLSTNLPPTLESTPYLSVVAPLDWDWGKKGGRGRLRDPQSWRSVRSPFSKKLGSGDDPNVFVRYTAEQLDPVPSRDPPNWSLLNSDFLSSTPRRPGSSELYIYAEIARVESGMGYRAEREW